MPNARVLPMADRVLARVAQESQSAPPAPPSIDPSFVVDCFHANELGDGSLFAAIHRGRYVYNHSAQQWMRWSGHHWDMDIISRASHSVEEVVATYAAHRTPLYEAKIEDAAIARRINRLRSKTGVEKCLHFAARCAEPLAIRGDEIDQKPWLLACRNGVIDLRTGERLDGRPEDCLLKAVPVSWEGLDAPCPRFLEFLRQVYADDPDLVAYVLRLFGHALIGCVMENVIPFFWGARGRNGKTVLFNVLASVLGPLAGTINPEMLMEQKYAKSSAGPSPDIMSLRGVRLLFGSEPDEKGRLSTARIKYLTGGEILKGRSPNDKYEVEFKPTHSFFLLANHLPDTGSSAGDDAFWARMAIIRHTRRWVDNPVGPNEHKAIKKYDEVLLEEAPGILAALVRGCLEYQRLGGLCPPPSVLAETSDYRDNEDLIGMFLAQVCIAEPEARVWASDLFEAFNDWFTGCGHGQKPKSQKTFGGLMTGRAEREKRSGITQYLGIRINPAAIEDIREKTRDKAREKRGGAGP